MADEIAFLGLGHMGAPMAANLLEAGRKLVVFDVVADAVKGAQAKGARVASSAAQAAARERRGLEMIDAPVSGGVGGE